ncbi:sigma-70 family RNA polymerase sigma factor [Ureibacillus manganicus]|uniref:RNA polymerase n=1 Tax=Ureibacillus manganicus DSM 26584 TaxID=1384049 RepID=A0A0A3HYS8_9BACL|nr:sigma-70 family RNA polymerase sigma factor [Ureibacillus manganicus]KGR77746.1 RNA polymerase [Ureibacillus manganicus DSM 26584]
MDKEIEYIFEEHSEHLLRLAYFYTKDRHSSEDIVQDVFIRFMNTDYEERGSIRAFLSKMTINKAKDYLKSWTYKKIQLKEKWSYLVAKKRPNRLLVNDERSIIGKAVLELSLDYREVIILYYYQEMSVAEISAMLLIPENTVKTRLKRAREKLKPLLQEDVWEVLINE